MSDETKYRRKPAIYEVVDRKWDASGEPYVMLLSQSLRRPDGIAEATAVRASWEEFKRDFEKVRDDENRPVAEPDDRCRAMEAIPIRYLDAGRDGYAIVLSDDISGRFQFARYDSEVGLVGTFDLSRAMWDSVRARWIDDGRPAL